LPLPIPEVAESKFQLANEFDSKLAVENRSENVPVFRSEVDRLASLLQKKNPAEPVRAKRNETQLCWSTSPRPDFG